jgi:hypothetical protein
MTTDLSNGRAAEAEPGKWFALLVQLVEFRDERPLVRR